MYRVNFSVDDKGWRKTPSVNFLESIDKTIKDYWEKYIHKDIIVFDVDGTIADQSERFHHISGEKKDWDAYFSDCLCDTKIAPIFNLMMTLSSSGDYVIFIVTGRSSVCANDTLNWLYSYNGECDELFMRKQGDYRPDDVVKEEWLLSLPEEIKSNISIVFEDRKRVVEMWRKHGIQCCQVSEGDF